ncbi:MAG: UvrD-helicase domain-containing protein [Galbitalea sp.]
MRSLVERMAPDVVDRIEFTGIHAFAHQLLDSRGVRVSVDDRAADRAFDAAWAEVGARGILGSIDPRKGYWKDEVISVIKGRGLTHFEQYAALARIGRRRGLATEARHGVWALYGEYELALREGGIHDFADLILMAERSLRATPLQGYSAVIADEAQDLSCAMIRMLHALVGDRADGLNLIGDGQQTIYAGGYTLAEADVSVAGRGVVMTTNYRNTLEIADFASTLVVGDEFIDIEDAPGASGSSSASGAPSDAGAPSGLGASSGSGASSKAGCRDLLHAPRDAPARLPLHLARRPRPLADRPGAGRSSRPEPRAATSPCSPRPASWPPRCHSRSPRPASPR